MTGGARHAIGALIGIVATPLMLVLLVFGGERLMTHLRYFIPIYYRGGGLPGGSGLLGGVLFLLLAVGVAVLLANRVPPTASLIPGVVFTLLGLIWLGSPSIAAHLRDLPFLGVEFEITFMQFASLGFPLFMGVVLLAGSAFPSRWRSAPTAAAGPAAQPHALGGAMPGQPVPYGAQPAPYGGQPSPHGGRPGQWGQQQPAWQPQYGQPQPPYGQPQPSYGQPQYGQQQPGAAAPPQGPSGQPEGQEKGQEKRTEEGGARPDAPASPASEQDDKPSPRSGSGGGDTDEPGDWTRMYGGGGGDRPSPPA
ncbi:hypothetical protein Arub01_36370 [Actinomadura rubrobrunea]|uniref:Uncharacterized protein n=1 Tax=Actinomadura rubrobrunea TaxID=115335 RepID=A0A9W6PYV4_9ACTN|nr:hypothetical protein [Actinomadura rubrobrunea]GLW65393.1 hypothetical protein Arub01_36370 [Actinomadura rubrobrunea]